MPRRPVAFLPARIFGLEESENLSLERGMHPEPLQTGQDRRQLVPAPEGQANLFDGRDLEIRLGLERGADGRKQWRMLQGQTPESPQTFNRSSNIRTLPFASNPMRARSFPALAAHYLTKPVNPVDLISARSEE